MVAIRGRDPRHHPPDGAADADSTTHCRRSAGRTDAGVAGTRAQLSSRRSPLKRPASNRRQNRCGIRRRPRGRARQRRAASSATPFSDEQRRREEQSLFADNVALSRRAVGRQPYAERVDTRVSDIRAGGPSAPPDLALLRQLVGPGPAAGPGARTTRPRRQRDGSRVRTAERTRHRSAGPGTGLDTHGPRVGGATGAAARRHGHRNGPAQSA